MAALAGSGLLLLLAALCWWRADHPVAEWCRPLDADWASVVSILGQAEVWLIPGAIGFAWYALRRNCNQARWCFLLGISIGISGGLVNVLKLLVARPRPHWDSLFLTAQACSATSKAVPRHVPSPGSVAPTDSGGVAA